MSSEEILFGSVCSGVSAASVSWNPLGWRAAWFHEIEAFPASVLTTKYPYAKNWGDMRQAPERVHSGELVAPDVLCGGTPCQAFSIGGARRSLDDERGNLTLTYCEIANEIDERRNAEGREPCVIFWENVLGCLTTKDNAFGHLLAGLAGEDRALEPEPRPAAGQSSRYWRWDKSTGQHAPSWPHAGCVYGPERAVAWRVLDAKHFGLAQRRPRVFVVASARDGFDPAAILLEWEGARRDCAPGRDAERPLHPCLTASGAGSLDDREAYVLEPDGRIRRTTVVEWERVQGFPDNYTLVDHRSKPAADGPRYKAIGNSWAVACTRWLGQRIQREFDRLAADKPILKEETMPLTATCEINRTDCYVETMSVREVTQMPNLVEIQFHSQLLTSSAPEERHLMRQLLVRPEAVADMVEKLQAFTPGEISRA